MAVEKRRSRVMHVENNIYVFRTLKGLMSLYEFANIHNVFCPDQKTAIKVLESSRHFDLIMTDHYPPTVEGIKLIRVVRSLPHRKNTPVLMVATIFGDVSPLGAGADAFLSKPPDFTVFKETIERLLSLAFLR